MELETLRGVQIIGFNGAHLVATHREDDAIVKVIELPAGFQELTKMQALMGIFKVELFEAYYVNGPDGTVSDIRPEHYLETAAAPVYQPSTELLQARQVNNLVRGVLANIGFDLEAKKRKSRSKPKQAPEAAVVEAAETGEIVEVQSETGEELPVKGLGVKDAKTDEEA